MIPDVTRDADKAVADAANGLAAMSMLGLSRGPELGYLAGCERPCHEVTLALIAAGGLELLTDSVRLDAFTDDCHAECV